MQAVPEAVDALASLEQRITRAVDLLTQLRTENQGLREQVKELSGELEELRGERKQVRARIEKLLAQMDLLSAS